MARRTTVREFAFVEGEHAEVDPKVLPDGYLTRAKNVRLRKDGRFGVRADFDALGNGTANAADWKPYDLIGFDGGLLSLGDGKGISGDTAPWDIADYAGTAAVDWRSSVQAGDTGRVGLVTNLRTIEGPSTEAFSSVAAGIQSTFDDAAAANGIVALVFNVDLSVGFTSGVAFLRASTGETVFSAIIAGIEPQVVAVGTKFFIATWGGTQVDLYKFDPATDTTLTTLTALTSLTTSPQVQTFDLSARPGGAGFWVSAHLAAGGLTMVPYNSSGVAGSAIDVAAVTFSGWAVIETATRINLAAINDGSDTAQLWSYTTAGSLSTGPTTVHTAAANDIAAVDATFNGTEAVGVFVALTAGDIYWQQTNVSSHASIHSFTWKDSFLGARPIAAGTPNYHTLFGIAQADGSSFYSNALVTADSDSLYPVFAYTDKFAAWIPSVLPHIARDASTGKFYWPKLIIDDSGLQRPILTEFDYLSSARRQSAQIGGLLYVASGLVQIYDGRSLFEAGFFERPRIVSATPSNGAGALPSSTDLLVAVTWEFLDAQGNFHTSDVSDVSTVTMGASDDTITLVATGPHGIKGGLQGPVTLVVWRSIEGISQLRRAETKTGVGPGSYTITLLESDDTVREQGVIYTQAARGALSGVVPHEAPLPADYVWKFGSRLLTANADQAQISKELFPGEPVNWSGAIGFLIPRISEPIVGVAALDQRGLLFTSEKIYQFSGDGPDDTGAGSYTEPLSVPSSTGLNDWRSLVETPVGLFFQGSNGQLWLLPRDGSPPQWIGQPVRDTLLAYPVVTSATLVTEEQLVTFSCNNSGLTDSRLVHYDLRAQTWIVDEFASATPVAAACSYQGRLALLSSGVVYTEKTTVTPNAFLEHGLTTGTLKPFGSTGWGKLVSVDVVAEYRGDCNLRLRISYDDGKTYSSLHTFPLLSSGGLSVGDTVRRSWYPNRRKCERFRLEFTALTAGSATEGLVFNGYSIEVMKEAGTSRTPAAQRA